MPTAKQLREQADLQAVRDRQHAERLRMSGDNEDRLREIIGDVAAVLTERAEHVEADNRKGAKGVAGRLRTAADEVTELAALLDANPAPTSSGPNPHREPLKEIPLHSADSFVTPRVAADLRQEVEAAESTDAKLEAAFGPVRAAFASVDQADAAKDGVIHITTGAAGGQPDGLGWTWCGEATGTRGYRGSATCPACIEAWEASRAGRPALATAQVNVPPPETLPAPGENPYEAAMQLFRDNAAEIERMSIPASLLGDVPTFGEGGIPTWSQGPEIPRVSPEEFAQRSGATDFGQLDRPTLAAPVTPAAPTITEAPRRMTLAEVTEHGRARARGAEHRSWSQISAFEECGVRYALSDLATTPAWWNVGGIAVHSAIERINLTVRSDPSVLDKATTQDRLWDEAFRITVAETEYTSGVPHAAWRAANKGAEAYDWWRVEGGLMVERWLDFLRMQYELGWRIEMVEQELSLPVTNVEVPVTAILDVVLRHVRRGWWWIIDIKAGKSAPKDGFQLGGLYHWALWVHVRSGATQAVYLDSDPTIAQSFWLARTGEVRSTLGVPWPDVVQRVSTMDAMERQGFYVPRPGIFCGSCEVRHQCPSGPQ